MKRATVLPLLLIFLSPVFAREETVLLNAESAVLVGADSGQLLFEKNGGRICPPASMTKLVTAYTALRLWEERGWDLNRRFSVPPAADFRAAPPHSSLMFLQAGQTVSLKELLCGLMIPSGNDAAAAVALLTVGSVEAFVLEMNRTMETLGFAGCRFADASGYSPQNRISPLEFAFFCVELIQKYPVIAETASLPSFTYPQPHNLNGTAAVYGFVRQLNHNELVGAFPGADGLKTGYIDASGNNVALTAERGGTRFVAVLTGIRDEDGNRRSRKRTADGAALLSYAFSTFADYRLIFPPFSGADGTPMHPAETVVTLEKAAANTVSAERRGDRIILMQAKRPVKVIPLEKPPLISPGKSVYPKPYPLKIKEKFDFDSPSKYINTNRIQSIIGGTQ